MPYRTPLLQLLDGVLAQSEQSVRIAMTEITRTLLENGTVLQLPHPGESPLVSVRNLHAVLHTLLNVFPEFARYQRDGSSPLHFAASLGDIHVASLLLSKVKSCQI
jgi:ankyrin repeat protein